MGVGEIRDEEAELVAAEARVQLMALVAGAVPRHDVLGADLLAQQARHPLDDAIAEGVPVGVVEALERADVHQAHRAPMPALLDFEELLEALDEAPEVHQPRLGVAMRAVGEIRHELFEVLGDAADRGLPRRQLLAHPSHAIRESGGHRLQRFLLRRLPHHFVARDDGVHRVQKRVLLRCREGELVLDPVMKVADRLGRVHRGKGFELVGSRVGHPGFT